MCQIVGLDAQHYAWAPVLGMLTAYRKSVWTAEATRRVVVGDWGSSIHHGKLTDTLLLLRQPPAGT